jgi:hypothetical protein
MTRFISCEFKVTKIGNWTLVQKRVSKILKVFVVCRNIKKKLPFSPLDFLFSGNGGQDPHQKEAGKKTECCFHIK